MNALLKVSAEAVCTALNQDPKGVASRLVADKWTDETFLERSARASRAVLQKVREGIESEKTDYAGDIKKQKILDWLDEALRT